MFQFLIGEFCQAAPRPLAFYDQFFPEGKIAPGICGFSCGEVEEVSEIMQFYFYFYIMEDCVFSKLVCACVVVQGGISAVTLSSRPSPGIFCTYKMSSVHRGA